MLLLKVLKQYTICESFLLSNLASADFVVPVFSCATGWVDNFSISERNLYLALTKHCQTHRVSYLNYGNNGKMSFLKYLILHVKK